ncbi:EamA family transporter [Candidatus Dependentiae bacterium]|nr:EamA family transporter [Candidatus Dependentiae bacterium]
MWLIYALLSALCAAAVAIMAKFSCKPVDIYMVTTIRAFIMAFTIMLVTLSLKRFGYFSLSALDLKDWLIIIATGIVGGLGWLFYFMALDCGNAAHVVAIDRLGIIFVLVLSFVFLGETLSLIKMLGGLIMIAGAYLIIYF